MQLWRRMRRTIRGLSPYPALVLLAVPLASVEILKVASLVVLGSGHWATGTIAILCAYALSLFVVERLFVLVKPQLLTLPWFAAVWTWFVGVRRETFGWFSNKWRALSPPRPPTRRARLERVRIVPHAAAKRRRR